MSLSVWFRDKVLMETPGISGPRFLRKPLERVLRKSRFDPKRHTIRIQLVDDSRGLSERVTTEDGVHFVIKIVDSYFDAAIHMQLQTIRYEFSLLLKQYEGEGDLGY